MQYALKVIKRTCGKCFSPKREEMWVLQLRNKKPDIQIEMIGYTCECGTMKVTKDMSEYSEPTLPMFK